jgi:hypothetical protein
MVYSYSANNWMTFIFRATILQNAFSMLLICLIGYPVCAQSSSNQLPVTAVQLELGTCSTEHDSDLAEANSAGNDFCGPANLSTFAISRSAPPDASARDAIQFVSPNGNDSNDGFSWGTAKRHMFNALQSLPGGSSQPPYKAGQGIIHVNPHVSYGGPVIGGGLWLMGANDPNFYHPLPGWLQVVGGGGIRIVCEGNGAAAANGHEGVCEEAWGTSSDNIHPAVWLSSVSGGIYIRGISSAQQLTGWKIGIDSSGSRILNGGSSGIEFDNVASSFGNCGNGATGPGLDVGSNTFWIYIENSKFQGCSSASLAIAPAAGLSRVKNVLRVTTTGSTIESAGIIPGDVVSIYNPDDPSFSGSCLVAKILTRTSLACNQVGPNATSGRGWIIGRGAAGIALDPGSGQGIGMFHVRNSGAADGGPSDGIRIVAGVNGAAIDVIGFFCEGSNSGSGPCVHVVSNPANGPQLAAVQLFHIESADNNAGVNPWGAPAIQVDGPFDANGILATDSFASGIITLRGPMTVLSEYSGAIDGLTKSPLREGQVGFFHNRIVGVTDSQRRSFSPRSVQYPNIAILPMAWTLNSPANPGATIALGQTAPDGTTGAAQGSQSGGPENNLLFFRANQRLALGDYFIAGVWARSSGKANKFLLNISGQGNYTSGFVQPPPYVGDGEWEWYFAIKKLTAVGTSSAPVGLGMTFTSESSVTAYGPVLFHIASGDITDNEAYELGYNLASFAPSCPVGSMCALPGEELALAGSVSGAIAIRAPAIAGANSAFLLPASKDAAGVVSATFVSTATTTDDVAIPGVTALSHCNLAATNPSAASNLDTTYVSAKSRNQITVTHAPMPNMSYDVVCTPN